MENRCINVLEMLNGIPYQIESFPIYEEQLSEEVVEQAEELMIKWASQPTGREFDEEEIDFILNEGVYDDQNGHEVWIIWSN